MQALKWEKDNAMDNSDIWEVKARRFRGVQTLFGQIPFECTSILPGALLNLIDLPLYQFWASQATTFDPYQEPHLLTLFFRAGPVSH